METSKIIKIDYEELYEALLNALKEMYQFDWTGWRTPIFVNEDGTISSGSICSQNTYQPDEYELPVRIESWKLDYEADDDDIDNEACERVDFMMAQLQENNEIRRGIFFEIN